MSDVQDPKPGVMAQPMTRWIVIGVAVVVIVAGAVGAYLYLADGSGSGGSTTPSKVAHTGDDSIVAAVNAAAASETGGLCERALTRAKSFAVLPDGARIEGDETATETEGQYTCQVQAPTGGNYVLAIRQWCDDLSTYDCLALNRVTAADGTVLFQRKD
jgi:hypothetical protein